MRHINKQVRQGEEQESLAAAAQRIGPYEVLEPSSEEMEKVREGRGSEKARSPGKWMNRKPGGKGQRCHRGMCPSFLPSGEGPGNRVQKNRKEGLEHFLFLQVED